MSLMPLLIIAAAEKQRQDSYRRAVNRRREAERKAKERAEKESRNSSSSHYYSRDEKGHIAYLIQNDEDLSKFFDDLGTGIRLLRNGETKKLQDKINGLKDSVKDETSRLSDLENKLTEKGYTFPSNYYDDGVYKDGISLSENLFTESPNRIETSYQKAFEEETPEECKEKLDKDKARVERLKNSKNPLFKEKREEEINNLERSILNRTAKIDKIKKAKDTWDSLSEEDKDLIKEYYGLQEKIRSVDRECSSIYWRIKEIDNGKEDRKYMETTLKLYTSQGRFTKKQIYRAKALVRGVIDEDIIPESEVISNKYDYDTNVLYDKNHRVNKIRSRRVAIKAYLASEKEAYDKEKRNKDSERFY